jgi:glutamate synthase domain-containing protein 1
MPRFNRKNARVVVGGSITMCGIMGFLDKTGTRHSRLGATMMSMLSALSRRGPDSAGVACYADRHGSCVLRVKVGEKEHVPERVAEILRIVRSVADVREHEVIDRYLRFVIGGVDVRELPKAVEAVSPEVEVISFGRSLELVKQTGSPDSLDARFHISTLHGTHAIAHTRLSTESRIDLSHSQPFWAHGSLDVASVHNGHITNYHKLRRQYEERGVRFYTENDSEIISVHLAEALNDGATLAEALDRAMHVFDGSFSFLASTADEIGFAKDRFGFKPLMLAETDEFVAIATEAVALECAFGEGVKTSEPPPDTFRTWRTGAARAQSEAVAASGA